MFRSARSATISAAALFLSAVAAGQSSDQPSPPLGGPKVKESKIPGVNEKFGDASKDPNQRKEGRGIPPEVIKRALGVLDRDGAPAEARLSDAQRTRIESLVAAFRDSVDAYKSAHRSEMDEVRSVLGHEGAEPGKPKNKRKAGDDHPRPPSPPPAAAGDQPADGRDDPMRPQEGDSDRVAGAKAKLAELRANAPSAMDLQTKIWNELTEPQRALVQAEVDRWIKEREEDKARDYVHKRLNKKGGPADQPNAPFDPENLPPKMKERLSKMTPEEREKALARIRERMKNSDKAGHRKGDDAEGSDKPAPSIDDVPIPSPDETQGR